MKNKLISFLLSTLVFLVSGFGAVSVSAENSDTVSRAQSLADGIISFKLSQSGSADVQEWLDGVLTENAGKAYEWYVFSISRFYEPDFSEYRQALLRYLSENELRNATARQKYSLILAATGGYDDYIGETLSNSIGEQGVMSVVYGLHLLNNGYTSTKYTAEEAAKLLISMRNEEGGWSVTGKTSDADVTAMAVQALTPLYEENETVAKAVDTAISLLSSKQLDSGGYSSYGVPCPESAAQVLTALSGLGIDAQTDERFIKNGNTLLGSFEQFRLDDGSFCHEIGKGFSDAATVQTLYSMISYIRMNEGKSSVYMLEKRANEEEKTEQTAPENSEKTDVKTENAAEENNPADYKIWLCAAVVCAGAVCTVILIAVGKRNKKNFIAVGAVTAAAVLFVLTTNFSTAEDYYGSTVRKEHPVGKVELSIICEKIIGKTNAEYVPENGIILTDSFEIEENETVFDILTEAAKKHSIQLEYTGTAEMPYISGINYIYEFDFGDLSGWLYYVNGESPSVGCGEYAVSDGDKIEWIYSCELGKDLR